MMWVRRRHAVSCRLGALGQDATIHLELTKIRFPINYLRIRPTLTEFIIVYLENIT